MILISAQGLGRQYAGDPIFSDLAFEVRAGDRIGLVGPNGAGKTTLMKLLDRTEQPEYGSIYVRPGVRISLLRQQPDFSGGQTLMDVARSGLASLLELQGELEEAAREMAEAEDEDDRERAGRRYDQIHEKILHQDAYDVDYRVEEILSGLGFPKEQYDRPAATFSGGQQSRMMLAKLLLEAPDLMLLDEPSNHLDIETTEWLEDYLSRQPVGMIIVSHDRYFLDKTVTKIWELHEGSLETYPGNYSQYWRLREERAKILERQAERFEEKAEKLETFIRKWSAGTKSKQAKDRERKLDRLQSERVETMRDIVGPVMGFEEVERSGDVVVETRHLTKAFDKPLFTDLNFSIERGQCVGVLGPNGAGKSTLIKTLIGREKPDSGQVKLGHKVMVGYHDQGLQSLAYDTTVVRAVWPEDDTDWAEGDVRSLLGRFGLSGDLPLRKVGMLSGGEKAKAALARLCATGANLLVMDEPTNHLDIWSCEALERSIREFEGTVLVVSHDRYFLNAVADRIVVVAGGGMVQVIEGDYEAYTEHAKKEKDAAEKAKARSVAAAPPPPAKSAAPAKPKNKKKFSYRPAVELEQEIARLEAEVVEVEDQLGQPATWRDPSNAVKVQDRHIELKQKLDDLFQHWEFAVESEW